MTVELDAAADRTDARACPRCGFEVWLPLADLRVSTAGLYDDARFPGRCLLVLDEHHDDLLDLPDDLLQAFTADLRDLRDAIRAVTGATRVNYASLGNAQPHVHWHVVPRLPAVEPAPLRSPWQDPRSAAPLGARQRDDLISSLQTMLTNRPYARRR